MNATKLMSGRIVNLAVCTLNQWALDFSGNKQRILKTCRDAYERGARVRLGPELEIPGYSCLDHFYEIDTERHSWEILRDIAEESIKLPNLLIITGMPIRYKLGLYNCAVALANGQLVFIYPKTVLANDDIYREGRWFVAWPHKGKIIDFKLDSKFGFNQQTVPFGNGFIESKDAVKLGFEMCEEMWTAKSPSNELALQGVEIICNPSGSHHVLGKSCRRINQLVLGTTSKLGGVYMYSNHRGLDGERIYFDGMSSIAQNNHLYAQIPQFDIEDTCTRNCLLDLDKSTVYRGKMASTCQESSRAEDMPRVEFDAELLEIAYCPKLSQPISVKQLSNVEEIALAPPVWLWHYLRRSKQSGFFLPLSGGQDSTSVALMVRLMCEKVSQTVRDNPDDDDPAYFLESERAPTDPAKMCHRLLFTCYMGSENSSDKTRILAAGLARGINANHSNIKIDSIVDAYLDTLPFRPQYDSSDHREAIALQNVQARSRMVIAYLHAQTALIQTGRPGNLLVLGTSNMDESLVGYVTKYDCSSADLNPIGAISKLDLREFLRHVNDTHKFPHLQDIIDSVPTAELRPLINGEVVQTDEQEIGLTYDELSTFGRLRRPGCLGPLGMFLQLVHEWHPQHGFEEIAQKVELFFRRYANNRHKATIATPAYHANTYSNDDHRNDHRPFLYPDFEHQFSQIREMVEQLKRDRRNKKEGDFN